MLMDAAGMRVLRRANDVAYSAQRYERGSEVYNDHDMVQLVFTLGPTSAIGDEAIGVRVKANVAAPVPIKVKYVAVGAA